MMTTHAAILVRLGIVVCAFVYAVVGITIALLMGEAHKAIAHAIICYVVHWCAMPLAPDLKAFNAWVEHRLAHA